MSNETELRFLTANNFYMMNKGSGAFRHSSDASSLSLVDASTHSHKASHVI